mgnify:CR=1 FL=1
MAKIDLEYCKMISNILLNGIEYFDVNRDVIRRQIPHYTFRHEFKDGFPAITMKKLFWNSVIGELIWFLQGNTDARWLSDRGINIWNKDALNHYNENSEIQLSLEEYMGEVKLHSVGYNYSYQYRKFDGFVDQIEKLVRGMKENIMSTYLLVTAWNPAQLNMTALAPCHYGYQIIGVPLENGEYGFELHWNQRSVDSFLGISFNIASYGLLALILEKLTEYKAVAIQGDLKCVHLYENQIEAATEMLKRNPNLYDACDVSVPIYLSSQNESLDWKLNKMEISDFVVTNYNSHEAMKVEMLSHKK